MYRSFLFPHYAASFPDSLPHISTETHRGRETVRQTDVVQQRVCVMSAASKGGTQPKVEMGFSEGLAWLVTMWWGEGEALVEAGEQPLQLTSTGRSCPTGY